MILSTYLKIRILKHRNIMIHQDITLIIGPTAVGKSDYALALAQETGAEIISADAYQIYKGLDIGSAKISKEDQDLIPHHLIDIKAPHEAYSVSDFLDESKKIIEKLRLKKTPIIICGGTGLYIQSFLYGYSLAPQDLNIRQKLEEEAEYIGGKAMWEKLNKIDPVFAKNLPYQNGRRVIRALEIVAISKTPPSQAQKRKPCREDSRIIGLNADRAIIHERINTRVDLMIDKGLIKEVYTLLQSGVQKNAQAFKGIGYKEVIDYIDGQASKEEMIKDIKTHTRRFAKRQMTWFKKIENVEWKLT